MNDDPSRFEEDLLSFLRFIFNSCSKVEGKNKGSVSEGEGLKPDQIGRVLVNMSHKSRIILTRCLSNTAAPLCRNWLLLVSTLEINYDLLRHNRNPLCRAGQIVAFGMCRQKSSSAIAVVSDTLALSHFVVLLSREMCSRNNTLQSTIIFAALIV